MTTKYTYDEVELRNLTAVEIAAEITKAVKTYGHENVWVETQLIGDLIRLYLSCKRPLNKQELYEQRKMM